MKVEHLHIFCQELEPAIAFFTEGLNGEFVTRCLLRGNPGAEIRMGDTMLYLRETGREWATQDSGAKMCGYNHLGFLVDDLDATLVRLLAMPDVTQDGEPFVVPEKKLRCVFLTGPSKLRIELMEVLK